MQKSYKASVERIIGLSGDNIGIGKVLLTEDFKLEDYTRNEIVLEGQLLLIL